METDLIPEGIGRELEAVFSEFGQRQSAPRHHLIELLTELAASGEGFTAEDLWNRVKTKDEGIGRATVFRAVKSLVDREVLDPVEFPDGTRLYRVCGERVAPDHAHHHHLACNQCHKIVDIHYCVGGDALETMAQQEGFRIAGHSITLDGLCRNCFTSPAAR